MPSVRFKDIMSGATLDARDLLAFGQAMLAFAKSPTSRPPEQPMRKRNHWPSGTRPGPLKNRRNRTLERLAMTLAYLEQRNPWIKELGQKYGKAALAGPDGYRCPVCQRLGLLHRGPSGTWTHCQKLPPLLYRIEDGQLSKRAVCPTREAVEQAREHGRLTGGGMISVIEIVSEREPGRRPVTMGSVMWIPEMQRWG